VRAPDSADGLRQHRRFVHARQGRFSVPAPTKRRRFGDEQHGVAAPGRFEGWTERAGRRVHDHLPLAADRRLDFSDDRWCERLPVSSRPCGNRIGPASSLLDLPDRLGSLSDRIAHAEEPAAAVSVTELREETGTSSVHLRTMRLVGVFKTSDILPSQTAARLAFSCAPPYPTQAPCQRRLFTRHDS